MFLAMLIWAFLAFCAVMITVVIEYIFGSIWIFLIVSLILFWGYVL